MKTEVKNDVAQLTQTEIDAVGGGIIWGPGPCIFYGPARPAPRPNPGDMRVNYGKPIGWVFR